MPTDWEKLNAEIAHCRRCPRLLEHCETIARTKRAAFRDQTYWGRPVPNFGDPHGRLLLLGLAPAAHGANRTGRMFTGDRSGDFLFAALHATGFANQPTSASLGDGLALRDCVLSAAAHCAPPDNKPTREEFAQCAPWLAATLNAMPNLQAVLCLGNLAYEALLRHMHANVAPLPFPRPRFAHGLLFQMPKPAGLTICTAYHPSQQNTFTGRLTMPMFIECLKKVQQHLA